MLKSKIVFTKLKSERKIVKIYFQNEYPISAKFGSNKLLKTTIWVFTFQFA